LIELIFLISQTTHISLISSIIGSDNKPENFFQKRCNATNKTRILLYKQSKK